MNIQFNQRVVNTYKVVSEGLSIVIFFIGLFVFFGWMFNIPILKSWHSSLVVMTANTATCLMLVGLSLWFSQLKRAGNKVCRFIVLAGGFIVALVGILTLIEFLFGCDLHIDQIIFKNPEGPLLARMSFGSALSFILVGIVLILNEAKNKKGYYPSQVIIIFESLIVLLSLIGYIYGVKVLYKPIAVSKPMALHTAISFTFACISILLSRPEWGLMNIFSSKGAGGIIARRLIFAAILIPLFVEMLVNSGLRMNFYDIPSGAALHTVLVIGIFTLLIWLTARVLDKTDIERLRMGEALKKSEQRLAKINDCLLNLGIDPDDNINRLANICGDILNPSCVLYNRLDRGMLCAVGKWNIPDDYTLKSKPDGHICYDVIKKNPDDVFIVRNLAESEYAKTDINVATYNLMTYMAKVIKSKGESIGALCVLYREDVAPTEEDKKVLGIIASAITLEEERKRAEEQLKNTQYQLVQSSKMSAIGRLSSGVAHEINNPLTGVLNNVQLIKMEMEQKSDFNPAEFKDLIGVVEESALRCKNIVKSLLDFSHASSGMLNAVSLNEIIEKVDNLVSHEMKLQNIIIEKQLNQDLPLVMGDAQLLQQVIFNLVSNAKWAIQKKSEKGSGTITITTKYNNADKLINVFVTDTGVGISKETIDRMFEPFFTTKPVGEGTGFGLALVYNIVKQHKGHVVIDSQLGLGATFKIFLPSIEASQGL